MESLVDAAASFKSFALSKTACLVSAIWCTASSASRTVLAILLNCAWLTVKDCSAASLRVLSSSITSQLYEAALEGLVLFLIINWFARKPRLYGHVTGLFLILYGVFRFAVEFVRQPDAQFVGQSALVESFSWMTRGQTLCIPMIILGLWFTRKSVQRLLGKSVSSS